VLPFGEKEKAAAHPGAAAFDSISWPSEDADDDGPQEQKDESDCHDLQLADHGKPPILETADIRRRTARRQTGANRLSLIPLGYSLSKFL
jgi:hypothetical protein